MSGVIRRVSSTILTLWMLGVAQAFAQTLNVVHTFDGVTAGNPAAGLTMGTDGFLYGTTEAPSPGAIFRVRPDSTGYEVLHTFAAPDGVIPSHAPLALGPGNVFFGTTLAGGANGLGTIYRLQTRGTLVTVTTVFSMPSPLGYPDGGVIIGRDGMLYGTSGNNITSAGAIYRVAQDGTGFLVLHFFSNGLRPTGTLIESSDGFLYGTTERGGATDGGTVFRIRPDGSEFTDLVELEGHPVAGVTEAIGPTGSVDLFGVEVDGQTAATQYGAVFRLHKDGTGFQRIGFFTGTDRDGLAPKSPLLLGADLNLYGTASESGSCPFENCGTVFRLSPTGTPFAIVALPRASAGTPLGALVQGPDGALYGVARTGGPDSTDTVPGHGAVFAVRNPTSVPLEFSGPAIADEGDVAVYTAVIRNTTNTTLAAPITVSVAPSFGLTQVGSTSNQWSCALQPDGRNECVWSTDIPPGADTDPFSTTYVLASPFPANCGFGPSPCVQATATLEDSGARIRVTTTARALVNGTLNSPPTPVDDTLPVYGTLPAVLRVLDNDSDPDGDTLHLANVIDVPRFGDVTINADGTLTYTPHATLLEPDTFRYEVDDQKFPSAARAIARVTVVPSTPTLTQTKTRIDLGVLAVGRLAAGRLHLDSNAAMTGSIRIEPVNAAEIATALQGTAHDPALAVSDPQAFAVQAHEFRIDPATYPFSGPVTIYYQAPSAVDRVSVAKVVMTAAPEGLAPISRQVLMVAASADAGSAPVRATDDFTATPVGTSVWYDVLANDSGPSNNGRRLYLSSWGCILLDSVVLGGTCVVQGTLGGATEGPASITGPQELRVGPPATGTGTAVGSYSMSELEECVTNPSPNGVCRLEGNMYFAQMLVDVGGTTPDLSLSLTPANATVQPGQSVTLTATVTNHGPGMASRVTVTGFADLTRLTSLVIAPSKGTCTAPVAGATVTCSLRNLNVGESATITFTGIADAALLPPNSSTVTLTATGSVQYGTTDSQPGDNTATATVNVGSAQADLRLTGAAFVNGGALVSQLGVGETVDYAFSVTNASGVSGTFTVTTTLPAGLTFVQSPLCTAAGPVVTCTGTLPGGQTSPPIPVTLRAERAAFAVGQYSAAVTVTSVLTPALNASFSTRSTSLTLLRPRVVIGDASFANPSGTVIADARVGDQVVYRFQIANGGSTTGTYSITTPVPAGLTLTAVNSPVGTCSASPARDLVTCTGTLPPTAASGTIAIAFQIGASLVPAGQPSASVSLTSVLADPDDPALASATASLTVLPAPQPDMRLVAAGFFDTAGGTLQRARVGDIVNYRIGLTNAGSAAGPFTITTTLPAGVTFGSGPGCTAAAQTVTCTGSSVASGASGLLPIAVRLEETLVPVGQTSATLSLTSVLAEATDPAFRSVSAALAVDRPLVDATPPVVALTAPANGAVFLLNQTVNAAYVCTDDTAVASCIGTVASGQRVDTASVGSKTFTVTARDAAGNQTVVTAQYSVVFPTTGTCLWNGGHMILPPINANGSSVFTVGLPVLARFRVCDGNGQPITSGNIVAGFRIVQRERAGVVQPLNSAVPSLLSPAVFRWEPFTQSWLFVVDTRTLARGWAYSFLVTLSDGSTIPFRFALR